LIDRASHAVLGVGITNMEYITYRGVPTALLPNSHSTAETDIDTQYETDRLLLTQGTRLTDCPLVDIRPSVLNKDNR
jgi:hypothetical protein